MARGDDELREHGDREDDGLRVAQVGRQTCQIRTPVLYDLDAGVGQDPHSRVRPRSAGSERARRTSAEASARVVKVMGAVPVPKTSMIAGMRAQKPSHCQCRSASTAFSRWNFVPVEELSSVVGVSTMDCRLFRVVVWDRGTRSRPSRIRSRPKSNSAA